MKAARFLTSGEIELARSMFGAAIDYSKVRLVKRKWWPFQPKSVAMAPTGHIYFHPHGDLWSDDFSKDSLGKQGLFIHEMTHVWQAQTEIKLAQVTQTRTELEQKVVMMRPGHVNADLLEEQARKVLGFHYQDEKLVIRN